MLKYLISPFLFLVSAINANADQADFKVSGKILNGTCGFVNSTLSFDLGTVTTADIPNVGDSTNWVTQRWESSGCASNINTVHMTFDGVADSSDSSLIAVSGGAQGIAVQLKSYDNFVAVPDNTTLMHWGVRDAGEAYEFKARYVRTSETLVQGRADASLIVNLTYN